MYQYPCPPPVSEWNAIQNQWAAPKNWLSWQLIPTFLSQAVFSHVHGPRFRRHRLRELIPTLRWFSTPLSFTLRKGYIKQQGHSSKRQEQTYSHHRLRITPAMKPNLKKYCIHQTNKNTCSFYAFGKDNFLLGVQNRRCQTWEAKDLADTMKK